MLFRLEEWQSPSGMWHCAHTASFPSGVDLWVVPARLLNMPADKFILYVRDTYNAEVHVREDGGFVSFSWKKIADMRLYKNKINALARQKNYQI